MIEKGKPGGQAGFGVAEANKKTDVLDEGGRKSMENLWKAPQKSVWQAVTILGVLLAFFLVTMRLDFFNKIETEAPIIEYADISGATTIESNASLTQKIYSYASFQKVSLLARTEAPLEGVLIGVYDAEGKVVKELTVTEENVSTNAAFAGLNEITVSLDEKEEGAPSGEYSIKITNLTEVPVTFALEADGGYGSIYPIENVGSLNIGIYKESRLIYYLLGLVACLLFVYLFAVIYLFLIKKLSAKLFFVLSAFFLGSIYLILFPPWSTNDAITHLQAAYRYSNILLGTPPENAWICRQVDADVMRYVLKSYVGGVPNPDLEGYYAAIRSGALLAGDSGALVEMPYIPQHMTFYKIFNYLPLALGIALGRILHLSLLPCIYLGRVLEGVVCAVLFYHAAKTAPVCKNAFMLIGLLPLVLMNFTAYSYDGAVLVVALNVIACTLHLSFGEGKKELRVGIELLVWAFLLGAVKGGGYLLILPIFLIPLFHAKTAFQKRIPLIATGVSLVSIFLWDYLLQDHTQEFFQFGSETGIRLSTSFAYKHPFHYLGMWVTTMISEGDGYLTGMLGSRLGWNEEIVPSGIAFCFLLLLILAGLCAKESWPFTKKDAIVCVATMALFLLITPSMLMRDTLANSPTISGIQGRYFLPILPLLLLVIVRAGNKKAQVLLSADVRNDTEKRMQLEREILLTFAILSAIVVYYMIRVYFVR